MAETGGETYVPPSREEKALRTQTGEQLGFAAEELEQIKPFLLETLGLTTTPEGGLAKAEGAPDEISQLLEQRAISGLQGEAGSAALEKDIDERRRILTEEMSRRLGDKWYETTVGQDTLRKFEDSVGAMRDQSNRALIGESVGLLGGREGLLTSLGTEKISQLFSLPGARQSLAGSFQSAQLPFQRERGLITEAELQKDLNKAQFRSDIATLAGQQLSSAQQAGGQIGSAALLASSKEFKENIEELTPNETLKISEKVLNAPVSKWNYKKGLVKFDSNESHIGMVTEDAPEEVVTNDGKFLDTTNMLGVLTVTIQQLHKRIQTLEERGMCHAH